MTDYWEKLKDDMRDAVLRDAEELVQLANRYTQQRQMVGAGLAWYQQVYGELDFHLPEGFDDAIAMGRAPARLRGRRRYPSNALKAAAALTQSGEVMVPLRMRHIHERLLASSLARQRPPSLATLQSTIIRSGLFERAGRGLWRLVQPVGASELDGGQLRIEGNARTED